MSSTQRSLPRVAVLATVIVIVCLAGSAVAVKHVLFEAPKNHLLHSARVGMTRVEVIAGLGEPRRVAKSLKDINTGGGYVPLPTEAPEKEILEYHASPIWKMYVYINHQDRVYKVLLART